VSPNSWKGGSQLVRAGDVVLPEVMDQDGINPRNNLDFIRTVLALGVLLFHTSQVVRISYPQLPWVPAFIAISGFLVTDSMFRSRGYGHFAWKRLLRIGPAFVLSFVLVAATGRSIWGPLTDWYCMGLCFGGGNPPLWSLSVEELLYLGLAICFVLGIYVTRLRAVVLLCAVYLLAVAADGYVPSAARPIIAVGLSFVSGSLLYVLRNRVPWHPIAGIGCMAFVLWLHNSDQGQIFHDRLIGPPMAYGLLALGLYAKPVFARYKLRIGDPSLGIYVYHFPILLWLYEAHEIKSAWLLVLTLLLTVPLALLSWHVVEKNALRLKDALPYLRKSPCAGTGGGIASPDSRDLPQPKRS
jgi:peptidoglycan/LPS O-acetylase OafA/YrhL